MAELTIVKADTLPVETRIAIAIDKQIDAIIEQYKSNRGEINRMVFDSVSVLVAGQARSAELSNQGFFKRFISNITGKNSELQNEINRNYALAQYAAQQILQKVSKQNLMSFELIMAVNNKLNAMMIEVANNFIEVNKEIKNIYEILGSFFKQSRNELLLLKSDVEDLNKRASILEWEAAIEYQDFDGIEYSALSKTGKIICLVKDFYQITEGNWSERNLLLFKAAFGSVNLNPKEKISYIEYLNALMKEPKLLEKLFDDVDLEKVDSEYTMILGVGKKFKLLATDEKYQVDTLCEIMADQNIQLPKEEIIRQLIVKYITRTSQGNMQAECPIYEFSLELLYNLWQVEHYTVRRYVLKWTF